MDACQRKQGAIHTRRSMHLTATYHHACILICIWRGRAFENLVIAVCIYIRMTDLLSFTIINSNI